MNKYIEEIMKLSKKAFKNNEVPIGCIIIKNNKIISKTYNTRNKSHNVIDHAEIKCIIKAAKKLRDWRLNQCEMYVTLKPCKMCEEVIKQSRIKKVYYLLDSSFNNKEKINVMEKIESPIVNEYKEILNSFFVAKR